MHVHVTARHDHARVVLELGPPRVFQLVPILLPLIFTRALLGLLRRSWDGMGGIAPRANEAIPLVELLEALIERANQNLHRVVLQRQRRLALRVHGIQQLLLQLLLFGEVGDERGQGSSLGLKQRERTGNVSVELSRLG